jgi:predicted PurR-regulated permease PerM
MDPTLPTRKLPTWISPVFILFVLYAIFFLPFWEPLLLAFLFSCACAPILNYIHSKLHSSEKVAPWLLMGTLVTLVIGMVTIGGIRIYSLLYSQFQNPDEFLSKFDQVHTVRAQLVEWLRHVPFLNDQNIEMQLNQGLDRLSEQARVTGLALAKAFVVKTPEIVLNLFIFLVAFAVFLIWGKRKWKFISRFTPSDTNSETRDYHKFEKICAISIGSIFLTGLVQATLVGIGSAVAGYQAFISFFMAFVLSLIPVVGAAAVPVFLALLSFATGNTTSAIILVVTALIAGSSDNVVRAWLFSRAANTNPVVSLLALLGGITLFGFTGLFLAPVVEQLVMSYLQQGEKPSKARATFPRWKGFHPKPSITST